MNRRGFFKALGGAAAVAAVAPMIPVAPAPAIFEIPPHCIFTGDGFPVGKVGDLFVGFGERLFLKTTNHGSDGWKEIL